MNRCRGVALAALPALVCATACSGYISKDAPPGAPPVAPGAGVPDSPTVPAAALLRRLTIREYNNTIRDLLGITTTRGRDFAIDQDAGGFAVGGPVSTSVDAARLLEAADEVATSAAAKLGGLLPCASVPPDPAGQADCVRQFVVSFGRRAFRRPLAADEVNDLMAVYTGHRGAEIGGAFADAVRAVVAAVLVSPSFLYHLELGAGPVVRDGGAIRFNPHETASRLSYALWGSMPDEVLFKEADAGRLASPEQIEQQARRMLADPRAADAIADFHQQWLEIDGLPFAPPKDARFKDYTPALVQAMLDETSTFAREIILRGNGSLEALLTASSTTVDPVLARLYGASPRAGLLTQGSFLAMHAETGESHPVKRGATILRRLLCTEVEPPPNLNVPPPPEPVPGVTTRERFAMHGLSPCATCHRLTDPLGFALESYDAVGAYRTTDQGKPVDTAGSVVLASGTLSFKNAVELAHALARSKEVQDCVATQWLRYLTRRSERLGDAASLQAAGDAFRRSSYDIRELLVALVRSRAFTHRSPSPGEVLP